MRVSFIFFLIIVFIQSTNAQSFAINTDGSTANASAILDVKSTDKGVLVPRISKLQRNAIATPAIGLLVFQNAPDSVGFYYYNGTSWLWLATASNISGWTTTGNAGTDTAVNFIGTTDNMPLRFKQNNGWVGQLDFNQGTYFIGKNAGKNNTSGIGNIAMGSHSLGFNSVASRNTVIGDSAMYTQSFNNSNIVYFSDNTAIGSKALFFNQPTTNSNGYKNTAVGSEALYLNTVGQENTAVGTGAMHDNTTGYQNVAIGRSAHRLSKSGGGNVYIGYEAGYNDSLGFSNTAMGYQVMKEHRSGSNNIAIGYLSLNGDTTGNEKSSYWNSCFNER
ncbi:MAG: hypothetical protein IPP48_04485 [Chitinophagaceae bacterium]|nr:hypothetical protein [Chitinophagaceae bacterium]